MRNSFLTITILLEFGTVQRNPAEPRGPHTGTSQLITDCCAARSLTFPFTPFLQFLSSFHQSFHACFLKKVLLLFSEPYQVLFGNVEEFKRGQAVGGLEEASPVWGGWQKATQDPATSWHSWSCDLEYSALVVRLVPGQSFNVVSACLFLSSTPNETATSKAFTKNCLYSCDYLWLSMRMGNIKHETLKMREMTSCSSWLCSGRSKARALLAALWSFLGTELLQRQKSSLVGSVWSSDRQVACVCSHCRGQLWRGTCAMWPYLADFLHIPGAHHPSFPVSTVLTILPSATQFSLQ